MSHALYVPECPTLYPQMLLQPPAIASAMPPFDSPRRWWFYFARNAIWHMVRRLDLAGREVIDAMAKAFGVDLPIHPQARAMLEARWAETGSEATPARLRMARVPQGAELIVNAVSAAPGFRIENVHVMAGVPKIMQAMLEAIAPTLEGGRKVESRTVSAGIGEGAIGDPLGEIQSRYDDIKIGSYPQMGNTHIMTYLVLRGHDVARLEEATKEVQTLVDRLHAERNIVLPKEPYA